MDLSPLQHHDGVNAASALENLAHRLVAVHHKKASELSCGRTDDDSVDLPIFSESEFGLDDPVAVSPISFLDRIRRFLHD